MVGLVVLFVGSGTTHLVRPRIFEPIVPRWLPRRRDIVYASGVAELVCAGGLLAPHTRRLAGWSSAALLAVVFTGNIQMTVTAAQRWRRRRVTWAGRCSSPGRSRGCRCSGRSSRSR